MAGLNVVHRTTGSEDPYSTHVPDQFAIAPAYRIFLPKAD
jgi:hypothetical protein